MSMSVDHQHHQLHQNSSNVAEQVVASVCDEQWTDSEFSLRQTQQQTECQFVSGSASANDTCMPGFYAPSVSDTLGHQPMAENILWTATEPVIYVGGYDMSGNCISGSPVFRSVDYPQHFSYGWFPGVDYGEWNAGGGVMVGGNQGYAESYYLVEGVGMENCVTINDDQIADVDVKALQQSLDGMRLEDGHCQFGYTMSSMPSVGISSFGQNGASWMLTANQYSHPNKALRAPQNGLESGSWSAQLMWDGAVHSHNSLPPQRGSSAGTGPAKLSFGNVVHPTYATADGSQSVLNFDLLHGSSGSLPNFGQYNPTEFSLSLENARFFIIKSYSEDDVHRSIKYGIWCSTEYGNKRLDAAYQECNGLGSVYLLFSVNGSGHFCGVAEMTSPVDYAATSSIWAQNKWRGQFDVRWIYVKDVPNSQLRHIKLENNENKPVTNSRDTQEVPCEKESKSCA